MNEAMKLVLAILDNEVDQMESAGVENKSIPMEIRASWYVLRSLRDSLESQQRQDKKDPWTA